MKDVMKILFLFFLGFSILFFREPYAFLDANVYAEDGIWTAKALRDGWISTFLHARSDYYVFFNIALLFISSKISYIVSGSPLSFLPQAIAIVSYSFYSVVAILIYKCLRIYSNRFFSMAGFLFSILVPLGGSTSESIGTLVQVGFYMPIISVCLHLLRGECRVKYFKYIFDIFIFLAAATNPVCFAVTGIYLALRIKYFIKNKHALLEFLPLITSLSLLFLIIIPNMDGHGGILGTPNPKNIIEMVTARSILYNFIFPWYSVFNDLASILFSFLFLSMCIFAYISTKNDKAKNAIIFLFSVMAVYTIATISGRYGLTGILNNYTATYPDRYFMGINVISSTLFVIVLSQLSNIYFLNKISYALVIIVLILHIMNVLNGSVISNSTLKYNSSNKFKSSLCHPEIATDGFLLIQIEPPVPKFKMKVPAKYINDINCTD
ncbi:hypothetical protein [Serratia sp. DD3]|uniref:hypothetical protein n=1 Tax=Serratia sp. DD3 TaxID=1410619 RepID=UPI0004DAA693|nr:hypothetical protein [Serratia sp. DD3]KEY57810.1 hypothetical protein SRDD_32900 [Serratia sp. DD3]